VAIWSELADHLSALFHTSREALKVVRNGVPVPRLATGAERRARRVAVPGELGARVTGAFSSESMLERYLALYSAAARRRSRGRLRS
jgi:hypothetical protein